MNPIWYLPAGNDKIINKYSYDSFLTDITSIIENLKPLTEIGEPQNIIDETEDFFEISDCKEEEEEEEEQKKRKPKPANIRENESPEIYQQTEYEEVSQSAHGNPTQPKNCMNK